PRASDEVAVVPVLEEELADEELRPGVDLDLAVPEILDEIAGLEVPLRIAGAADAELDPALLAHLAGDLDEIARVLEPLGVRDELALPARRIAPQRQHVGDPGVADDRQLLL